MNHQISAVKSRFCTNVTSATLVCSKSGSPDVDGVTNARGVCPSHTRHFDRISVSRPVLTSLEPKIHPLVSPVCFPVVRFLETDLLGSVSIDVCTLSHSLAVTIVPPSRISLEYLVSRLRTSISSRTSRLESRESENRDSQLQSSRSVLRPSFTGPLPVSKRHTATQSVTDSPPPRQRHRTVNASLLAVPR